MAKYKISFRCAFEEFWRYNLYITGKVFLSGECVEFIKHSDVVADVGASLKAKPSLYYRKTVTTIHTCDGDALTLYIYVVAHTLPQTNSIEQTPPFKSVISISNGSQVVFEREYMIDQWGGDNIEIKLPDMK